MNTNNTSNLPKARISRLSRKDIEAYQEALGNDAHSEELVAEFAVAHVKAHALQTEIYRRIASGNKRNDTVKAASPNAERARIIAKAKEFVEKCRSKKMVVEGRLRNYVVDSSFIVNADKRTVVALLVGVRKGLVRVEGIAKCNPDDVFNEHIGKAIALGRALGKDVSEFENAPQPTEPVVGHKLSNRLDEEAQVISPIAGARLYVEGNDRYWWKDSLDRGVTKIIDDTFAIYEDVTT